MTLHVTEVLLGPLSWALRAAPQPRSVPTSIPPLFPVPSGSLGQGSLVL